MSAVQDLKQRRAALSQQIVEIDAVLRQLGATAGPARRARPAAGQANSARSEAAKKMWADRRAAAAKPKVATPKVRTAAQRQRNAAHPAQAVSRPASLAAAAE